jgi:hypothetical protein
VTENEQKILVQGIPVPISVAGEAVSRCIRGIQLIEKLINVQGFASRDDLLQIKRGLTGEDVDENVASAGKPISE